jgi:hypothetical protein
MFHKLTKIIADPIKSWKWAPQAFHPSYWTRCVNGVIEKKVYIDQLIEKGKKDLAAGKEPDCMLENFRNCFFSFFKQYYSRTKAL